ncbi:SDR family NAD(P)-dependent oxidoreductase [Alteromonas sp. NFXS44]|uniref:SDR family NAD(P)-dependent oxidoreductase n=1 Tax=Alteromonas sp. NFXS44 TaxID=2818435 RepID=UPI0032DF57DF
MSDKRLDGKVCLVTGAGQGIGKGIALKFAELGAHVVVTDLNPNTVLGTVSEITQQGSRVDSFAPCNLINKNDVKNCMDFVIEKHGKLDVLVNAGAIHPHLKPFSEMDYDTEWCTTMVGEVDVVFLLTQAAWPHLKATGNGSIINFASVSAQRGSLNMGMSAHCAGKSAVMALTWQMAIEGGADIRANSIAPGMVTTPGTQQAGGSSEGPVKDAILARVPRKRLGTPEDIAWAAAFLASDESSWITGAMLPVDGGTTCC